ncbi:MAG: SoxR reducing system RseC family protein [Prevotellaceae bacterium]|jgi:sigma-E factor negative regulatory protein RseC|nr:SoxR reducing system RseC family protein [Prevotellaceae bacterium]
MAKEIKHSGVIMQVDEQGILVRIERVAACAACHAKDACMAADMEEKIIGVPHTLERFEVGEEVNVAIRQSIGMKAVMYGYMLPLAVLMVVLITLITLGVPELYAGLGTLAALAGYYIVLFVLRSKIEKQMTFTLEKIK